MKRSHLRIALLFVAANLCSPQLRAEDEPVLDPEAPDQSAAEKELEGLGKLRDDLGLWLSLDAGARGGVAWSRFPIKVKATDEVVFRQQDGRKYADFRTPGAHLRFERPFKLGASYTLCTWMLLPVPKKHGTVWQGAGEEKVDSGAILTVTDTELYGWSEKAQKRRLYAKLPEGVKGWHHVAVTVNEGVTTAYLDGKELGSVKEVIATTLSSVGGHWYPPHQHWMMCDSLDEQFYFRGALSAEEIKKVMAFKQPAKAEPAAAEKQP